MFAPRGCLVWGVSAPGVSARGGGCLLGKGGKNTKPRHNKYKWKDKKLMNLKILYNIEG